MTTNWLGSDLKECPFCGHDISIFRTDDDEWLVQGIHCPVCGYNLRFMDVKIKHSYPDEKIIKCIAGYWNRRDGNGIMLRELKDCPFCGRTNVHLTANYDCETNGTYCGWCNSVLQFRKGTMTRDKIIEFWNRRPGNE